PGGEGELGILPRHAPLLTTLQPGVMRLKNDGAETIMAVSGGFLQVFRDRVLVLADTAERADEIEERRAEEARQRAVTALQERGGSAGLATRFRQRRRGWLCVAPSRGWRWCGGASAGATRERAGRSRSPYSWPGSSP